MGNKTKIKTIGILAVLFTVYISLAVLGATAWLVYAAGGLGLILFLIGLFKHDKLVREIGWASIWFGVLCGSLPVMMGRNLNSLSNREKLYVITPVLFLTWHVCRAAKAYMQKTGN